MNYRNMNPCTTATFLSKNQCMGLNYTVNIWGTWKEKFVLWIHNVFSIPTARWIFLDMLGIRILITNSCKRCMARNLQGFSQDGGQDNFFKTFAPLSLIKTYRMSLLSARSISLDSTFKHSVGGQIQIVHLNKCPYTPREQTTPFKFP